MQPTDKFRGDLDSCLRRCGDAPEQRKIEALRAHFLSYFRALPQETLAALFATFVEKRRADPERAMTWLSGVGSLLLMDYDGTPFDRGEWEEIREAVNLDSGEMDLDLLSYVMTEIVEHGAI